MTAFPSPEVEARAAAIRDCRLVAKPFDLFDFFDLVQELIRRGPRRQILPVEREGSRRY
jgi:hypothetical protein